MSTAHSIVLFNVLCYCVIFLSFLVIVLSFRMDVVHGVIALGVTIPIVYSSALCLDRWQRHEHMESPVNS